MSLKTDMPRAERVLRIFTHLIRNRGKRFTTKEIQRTLEEIDHVSIRNVQRDLQLLCDIEETTVTSYTESGSRYFTIEPDYRNTVSLPLGENSLLAFFIMERLQPFFKEKEKAFGDLKEKLISGGKRDLSDLFFDVEDNLDSSTHIFEENSRLSLDDNTFSVLLESLAYHKEIKISYMGASYQKPKELTIQPVKLALFKNDLFFACKPQKSGYSAMIIKLCRINSAEFTGKEFSLSKKLLIEVNDQLSRNISIFDDNNYKPQQIEIHFPANFRYLMTEKKYHSTQKMTILEDGTVAVTMNISPDDFMVQWILQWGDQATVIKPKSLIKKLRVTGENLVKKYST